MLANALKKATGSVGSNIEFVSSLSTTYNGTLPTHESGDLIIATACNFDSGDSIATPSGWTSIGIGAQSNAGAGWYLLYRTVYRVATNSSQSISWNADADIVNYIVVRNASSAILKATTFQSSNASSVTAAVISFTESDGSSAALIWPMLRNETGVTLNKPSPAFTETHSTNVGSHQGISFFKAGINYFPTTVLSADQVITYALTQSIEILA